MMAEYETLYCGTSHPWDHAKWLLYRGGPLIEVSAWHIRWMTHPTGWYIEGDPPNQVAASTSSTVYTYIYEVSGQPMA